MAKENILEKRRIKVEKKIWKCVCERDRDRDREKKRERDRETKILTRFYSFNN